jgi:hypothetical protein
MDAYKLSIKLFAEDPTTRRQPVIGAPQFVPVFHSWIQTHAVPDHLLVDVADYDHVESGPGTALIAHEGNFYTDRADHRLGIMYQRKQPLPNSTFADRLAFVFRTTLEAAARLESDSSLSNQLRFRTDEAVLRIHDRLLAPNTSETFLAVKPDLERFFAVLYPRADVRLTHRPSPQRLFEVQIKSSEAPALGALLDQIELPHAGV